MMIEVGEHVAIIGENGVGKTTFLRTIMGEAEYQPHRVYTLGRKTLTLVIMRKTMRMNLRMT